MTSRSPTRFVVVTLMTLRLAFDSAGVGSRSALRMAATMRSPNAPSEPRSAVSSRSGMLAKLASPSRAAKTAPPIRAAPHRPVRIVPLNHCTETRRRSTVAASPSTDSGASSPSSVVAFHSNAPRSLRCSKDLVPHPSCFASPWKAGTGFPQIRCLDALEPRDGRRHDAALSLKAADNPTHPPHDQRFLPAGVGRCSQVATHSHLPQRTTENCGRCGTLNALKYKGAKLTYCTATITAKPTINASLQCMR